MPHRELRNAGACYAAVIALTLSVAIPGIGLPGVIPATFLGYRLAPRLLERSSLAVWMMGLLVIPLSALLVSSVFALAATTPVQAIGMVLVSASIGTAIFGLPALVITMPAAVVWGLLVRRWMAGKGLELHDRVELRWGPVEPSTPAQ